MVHLHGTILRASAERSYIRYEPLWNALRPPLGITSVLEAGKREDFTFLNAQRFKLPFFFVEDDEDVVAAAAAAALQERCIPLITDVLLVQSRRVQELEDVVVGTTQTRKWTTQMRSRI